LNDLLFLLDKQQVETDVYIYISITMEIPSSKCRLPRSGIILG
jgi:hypothetical protein